MYMYMLLVSLCLILNYYCFSSTAILYAAVVFAVLAVIWISLCYLYRYVHENFLRENFCIYGMFLVMLDHPSVEEIAIQYMYLSNTVKYIKFCTCAADSILCMYVSNFYLHMTLYAVHVVLVGGRPYPPLSLFITTQAILTTTHNVHVINKHTGHAY